MENQSDTFSQNIIESKENDSEAGINFNPSQVKYISHSTHSEPAVVEAVTPEPIEAEEIIHVEGAESESSTFTWLAGTLVAAGGTAFAVSTAQSSKPSSSPKENSVKPNNSETVKSATEPTPSSSPNNPPDTQDTLPPQNEHSSNKPAQPDGQREPEVPNEVMQPSIITTKIYYPNGDVLTHKGETALDLANIQYKTYNAQELDSANNEQIIYIDKSHPAFAGLLAGAEAYIKDLSDEQVQQAIANAYKIDSDGDGIIDLLDRSPSMWNVSDRDLRIFSTLAYESKNSLTAAFNQNDTTLIKKELADGSIKVGDTDVANVDLDLLTQHWTLLNFGSPGSGLQYAVFGNGAKPDGSYQNIIVAFRGTSALNDLTADIKIYNGNVPTQATYLDQLADSLAQYRAENIYATGHSLGGYLAQYFSTKSVVNSQALQDSFKHSALFNPVPLPNEKATIELRQLSDDWSRTEVDGERYNITSSYIIKGEMVYDGAADLAAKISNTGLFATIGSLIAGLFTGGLAWVTAAGLIGGLTAANKDALSALAKGLGGYENSEVIDLNDANSDPMTRHKMVRFYDQHGELKAAFTQGYRMDNHYLHDDSDTDGLSDYQEARIGTDIHLKDTDGDGIADAIEIKVNANALNSAETPWAVDSGETHFDTTPVLVTAEVIEADVSTIKGLVFTPSQQADGVLYTVSEVIESLPSILINEDITHENNLAWINATEHNDLIEVGSGSVLINTLAGNDSIQFNSLNNGAIAYLNDFDPSQDKLLFAQDIFADSSQFQYDQNSGKLSYSNIHFATFEQGLALDMQQFELI
ncbi:Mbeg1-like protein [Bibersteinia trehalosi]|uniref:Mbeg1-like protein n=1 Tax=Bibersteinia trehalosi TaxID=47735 RepID=UPI002D79EE13|nr:hypothetical protein [Bibersteinia trehalosi]